MSRSVGLLVALGGLACTRVNPAFDQAEQADELGSQDGTESGAVDTSSSDDNTSVADTNSDELVDTADTNDTSDGPLADVPLDGCESSLGFPLSLHFSSPELWPNECPIEAWVQGFLEFKDGGFAIRACDGGQDCSLDCQMLHPINAADFDFEPVLGTCVQIEAEHLQGPDADGCSYGALSVFPVDVPASPIFVGTTRSAEPTFTAKQTLAGWPQLDGPMGVPEPYETCSCDELDVVSDCCAPVVDTVDIYAFLLGGGMTIAQVGTHSDYFLEGSNFEYSFYAAMAQRVGTCSNSAVETSWKLFATGGF